MYFILQTLRRLYNYSPQIVRILWEPAAVSGRLFRRSHLETSQPGIRLAAGQQVTAVIRTHNTRLKSHLVTIELTRKHAVLFAALTASQMLGLWLTFNRSPDFARLSRAIWAYFFVSVPGSAF